MLPLVGYHRSAMMLGNDVLRNEMIRLKDCGGSVSVLLPLDSMVASHYINRIVDILEEAGKNRIPLSFEKDVQDDALPKAIADNSLSGMTADEIAMGEIAALNAALAGKGERENEARSAPIAAASNAKDQQPPSLAPPQKEMTADEIAMAEIAALLFLLHIIVKIPMFEDEKETGSHPED